MKFKYIFLAIPLVFLFSCEEEDDEIPAPIVNIDEEPKGDPITFSIPNNSFIVDGRDTFAIISGGVPPYIITDREDIFSPILKGDTLFFTPAFNSSSPGLRFGKITIQDSRAFNQAQLSIISSPRLLTFGVRSSQNFSNFNLIGQLNNNDSINFYFQGASLFYDVLNQTSTLATSSFSTTTDYIRFTYLSNGNDRVTQMALEDRGSNSPFSQNRINTTYSNVNWIESGTNSQVRISTNYLGIPERVNFHLFFEDDSNASLKLELKSDNLLLVD